MDVSCPRCGAGYQVDEARIPAIGLRMRCPKCGGSVLVDASGAVSAVGGANPTMQGFAPPPPPPARSPKVQPTAAPPAQQTIGELDFGDLDLPEPVDAADLPAPVSSADLPAPARPRPKPPAPSARAAPPPPPPPAAERPASAELDLDLPGLVTRPSQPELPARALDLPAPLSAIELPTPKAAREQSLDFQDLDLPEPMGAGLPAPAPSDLLTPSQSELMTPASSDLAPTAASDLPVRKGGEDLPARSGGLEFGEVDLAPAAESRDSMEFDGFPVEGGSTDLPLPREMSPGGAELDLVAPRGMIGHDTAAGGALEVAIDPGRTSRVSVAAPPTRARKRRSRKFWQVSLLVLLLGILGGGVALSWTPYGLFASNVLVPLLPRAASERVGPGYLRTFRLALKMDTYSDYRQTLSELRVARKRSPSDASLRAYAAHVRYMMSFRFGPNPANDRLASRLAETLDLESPEQSELVLAAASREAFRNQLPRAESRVARMTGDPDALALAGWIALLRGSLDLAEQRFGKLAQIERGSVRAAYGLLQAKVAREEWPVAKTQAASVLEMNSHHVGARLALARILWEVDHQERESTLEIEAALGPHARFAAPSQLAEGQALLGRIQIARSRFGAAKASFEAALAQDPRRVEALVGLGQVLLRERAWADAQTRFDAARRIAPDDLDATIGAAGALIGLDRLVEAKDLLTGLGAERLATGDVQFWIGRTEETLGNADAAETAYRSAIEKKPELVEASVRLAAMLERAGKAVEARALLEGARTHAPDTADAHAALGEGFAARGQLDVAEVELRRALQIDAEHLPAEFQLGVVLRRSGRYDEAKGHFEAVAARDPAFPGLSLERGRLFEETGDAERALAMYQELLRASPDDPDLELRVGATSYAANHLEDAERILREVVLARPGTAEAQHFLGRALLDQGQSSEATGYLRRAVDLDGDQADHHLYYGWALDQTGALPQALAAFDEAIRIDAENAKAYWRRGLIRLRLGGAPEARDDLQKAIALSPDLAGAHAALADAFDRLRNTSGALAEYAIAIQENGDEPEWQYRYGFLLLDAGRTRDARAPLERAVTLLEPVTPKPFWYPDIFRNLGTARRATGDRAGAAVALRRYLELAPADAPDRRDVTRELEDL